MYNGIIDTLIHKSLNSPILKNGKINNNIVEIQKKKFFLFSLNNSILYGKKLQIKNRYNKIFLPG